MNKLKRQKIYLCILILLCLFWIYIIPARIYAIYSLSSQPDEYTRILVLALISIIDFFFLLAGIITIVLRLKNHPSARELTRVYNWFLLIDVPIGTVIGLIGIFTVNRVDKR